MAAVLSLLIILIVSILITRVATVALTHTGLSRQTAKFQARSAFTGVGFTTSESERIVNHPLRRKILLILMLLGNAGIVSAMASLILGFVGESSSALFWRVAALLGGVLLLWFVASSSWIDRHMSRLISRLLSRHSRLSVRDYEAVLHVSGDYAIHELGVEHADWLSGQTLKDLRLRDEGVQVLGITRTDGTYIGVPRADTRVRADDNLLLYGREAALKSLDRRGKGAEGTHEHDRAVAENQRRAEAEARHDPAEDDGVDAD